MKLDTLIPYLKKIQKMYKSHDTPLVPIKMVAILMLSTKLTTLGHLKIKVT